MRIGILQTGHAPDEIKADLGEYSDMFARFLGGQDFTFDPYMVVDMQFPASVTDADGWLITGSKHGVYEDHPFIAPLEQFIRDAYAAYVPVVGICFGHQIMAQAMGGKVEKFDGGWSVGRTGYTLEDTPVALNAWHQDQVTKKPDSATVIGNSDFCKYAGLAYDDRMFSVQPHPEFGSPMIEALTRLRGPGVVPDDLLAQARDQLDQPNSNADLAQRIGTFFKQAKR